MDLKNLGKEWNVLGKSDPFWAVLTWPEKKGGKWKADEFFQTGINEVSSIFGDLRKFNLELAFGQAMDFGCGAGRLTQALAAIFDEVVGVDIAASMIETADRYNQYPEKCRYFLNKGEQLETFTDSSFDFVLSRLTLQNMEPQYAKGYIQEFARILRPKGVLVFQLPSALKPQWKSLYERGIRGVVKKLFSKKLLNFYRKIRARLTRTPIMEMYGIEKNEVVSFLERLNFTIINVAEVGDAGPEWISNRYVAVKMGRD